MERYDHHCPWINNCVGVNNHSYFIIFIGSLVISVMSLFASSIKGLIYIYSQQEVKLNGEVFSSISWLLLDKWAYILASYFVILASGFFILPVGFLFYIQIKNFVTNKTTNERFSRKAPKRRVKEEEQSLLESTKSMTVEEIIAEMGDPLDEYNGDWKAFHNCG